ncbi:MAG: YdbL family protein [Steroidobacteraceae bacterium]
MRRFRNLNMALASLAFAACVTINVYFPAASAERAADQIIDTVTSGAGSNGANSSGTGATTPPPQSKQQRAEAATPLAWLGRGAGLVLEALVPAAHAQSNANIDISSPEIRAITASMQARFEQLQKYFASGAVGLTANGLVELRDQSSVPLAERAIVKRLVAEDNRDRNTLYAEIAKANGHPEWEADIRGIFARRWVERGAQPGWYYQDASGSWQRK